MAIMLRAALVSLLLFGSGLSGGGLGTSGAILGLGIVFVILVMPLIGGGIYLFQRGGAEAREYAGEIAAAAERAGAMTRQLLTFSRKQELRLTYTDLNDVVWNVQQLLRRRFKVNQQSVL